MIAPRAIGLPRSPPRDPGDIDGLTVWLEADRGVVLDASGNVSEWRDQSGRGNHATQGTDAARPLYTTAGGRMCLQTTLAARFIEIPTSVDLDPSATLGLSLYIVYSCAAVANQYLVGRWAAAAASQVYVLGVNDGAATNGGVYISETGTNTARRAAIAEDCSTSAPRVLRLRYDPAGQVRAQAGGTAYGPTAIAGVKAGAQGLTIGRQYTADAANGCDANVFALALFRRDLTTAEDEFVRDYFRRRWAAT